MKIIFIGTVQFSLMALQKLVDFNAHIVGVATKQESPFNADFADLTPLCEAHGIPCRYTKDMNRSEDIKWIRSLNPDVIFCFGWSSLLKREILNSAPMGVIGFHPAELPKNRGRHPIIWALVLGLQRTASTFFFMGDVADNGDILSQEKIDIMYEDDARSLYEKVTKTALRQIEVFLPQLQNGTFSSIPQDHSQANSWRKRTKEDGKIDFRMSSRAIYNLVRALTRPYVGAHIEYSGHEVKVWKVQEFMLNHQNIEPGKILDVSENKILVKCFENAILITEHEFSELPKVGVYFL